MWRSSFTVYGRTNTFDEHPLLPPNRGGGGESKKAFTLIVSQIYCKEKKEEEGMRKANIITVIISLLFAFWRFACAGALNRNILKRPMVKRNNPHDIQVINELTWPSFVKYNHNIRTKTAL